MRPAFHLVPVLLLLTGGCMSMRSVTQDSDPVLELLEEPQCLTGSEDGAEDYRLVLYPVFPDPIKVPLVLHLQTRSGQDGTLTTKLAASPRGSGYRKGEIFFTATNRVPQYEIVKLKALLGQLPLLPDDHVTNAIMTGIDGDVWALDVAGPGLRAEMSRWCPNIGYAADELAWVHKHYPSIDTDRYLATNRVLSEVIVRMLSWSDVRHEEDFLERYRDYIDPDASRRKANTPEPIDWGNYWED